MAEILNEEDEVKLKIRLKSQRHVRAVLIVLNLLLVGYLVYFTSDSIKNEINKKNASIVALNDLNKSESLERYEELSSGKYITMGDYVLYGHYLHFSESRFDITTYTPLGSIILKDTSKDNEASYPKNIGQNLDQGINLSILHEGDYLVSYGENEEIIKVVIGKEKYEETIYTLPLNNEGLRKKITLYAYPENPAFVIKIKDVYALPSNYYDIIIQTDSKDLLSTLFEKDGEFSNLKVKWLDSEAKLKDAYSIFSNYAISAIENSTKDEILSSSFIDGDTAFTKCQLIKDTSLKGLDESSFIRELGGYVFKSGSRCKEIPDSFAVVDALGIHDAGKMAFEIHADNSDNKNDINNIAYIINGVSSVINYINPNKY